MAKPLSEMSLEELEGLKQRKSQLSTPVSSPAKVSFKSPTVEKEYDEVYGPLKSIVESSPAPITITSGRRSINQNAAVGGVPNSYHTTGGAVDIRKSQFDAQIRKHFQDNGWTTIDEGDHIHAEPPSQSMIDTSNPLSKFSIKELEGLKTRKLTGTESTEEPQALEAPNPELDPMRPANPAGSYKGFSMLGPELPTGQYATPQVRKKAIDRLLERGDQPEEAPPSPLSPPADDIRENMRQFYEPNRIKARREQSYRDIGDALYGFANFNTPGTKDEAVRGVLPRAVGMVQSLFPSEEDSQIPFESRVAKNRAIENEVANLRKERSPIAYGAGRLTGDTALYSNILKLLGGVPGLAPAAEGEKVGMLERGLRTLARGGTAGYLSGQAQEGGGNPTLDIALGAGGEAIPAIFGGAKNLAGKALNKIRETNESGVLPEMIAAGLEYPAPWRAKALESAERKAKSIFESEQAAAKNKLSNLRALEDQAEAEARRAYDYEKTASRNRLRDLSEADASQLGQQFSGQIKSSKKALSKEYGDIAEPLMAKYGEAEASVDGLRSEIQNALKQNNLLDKEGKVATKNLDLVKSPERKRMLQTLLDLNDNLATNPSIQTLNALKQDLQSLANPSGPIKSPEQALFGKLATQAKDSLDNALEVAAGPEAEAFKAVRQKYAQQKPTLDTLSKIATRQPERLVVNARPQFPKSRVQEILKTNPEFKPQIADFIFEHFTQTPASQNTIRKTMDYYGRDFLKDLLGTKRFNSLVEAENALTKASAKFSPKNFPNEELQKELGKLAGPESVGPYSPNEIRKNLQDLLERKFQFDDPFIAPIQKKITKLIGASRSPLKKGAKGSTLRLQNAIVPALGSLFKDNQPAQ